MLSSRQLVGASGASLSVLLLSSCKLGVKTPPVSATAATPVAAAASGCAADQPTGDPAQWLSGLNQFQLRRAFECAGTPAQLPTGKGKGTGSLVQGLAIFNLLQMGAGAHIWGGKKFYEEGGGIKLVNMMIDNGTERYNARVGKTTSILDGKPTVILDYRIDKSLQTFGAPGTPMQKLVDEIVLGIRDEIRELQVNGQGTGVYVGRAHMYLPYFLPFADRTVPPSDAAFESPASWIFAANFVLDFRTGQ
jgi:hypothetical protein